MPQQQTLDAEFTARRQRERRLVLSYQSDPASRDAVVEEFRPLAHSLARRYHRGEEPLDDLKQVALLGLVKALERFDPDRGSPFVTYAMPTITGELRRHYRDTGWAVHVARTDQELAQRVANYERGCQDPPTVDECAEALGLTSEQVVTGRIARNAMRADSLDRPRPGDDEDGPALDPGAIDAGYRSAETRATIGRLTSELPERERLILALRYGSGYTQSEIADRVGVSQMQVSRILRRTLNRLALEAG